MFAKQGKKKLFSVQLERVFRAVFFAAEFSGNTLGKFHWQLDLIFRVIFPANFPFKFHGK
jgi:hypothetical protein